jgi:hypothetical protein
MKKMLILAVLVSTSSFAAPVKSNAVIYRCGSAIYTVSKTTKSEHGSDYDLKMKYQNAQGTKDNSPVNYYGRHEGMKINNVLVGGSVFHTDEDPIRVVRIADKSVDGIFKKSETKLNSNREVVTVVSECTQLLMK